MRYLVGAIIITTVFGLDSAHSIGWSNFGLGGKRVESAENAAEYYRSIAFISEALALIELRSVDKASPGQVVESLQQAEEQLTSVSKQLTEFASLGELIEHEIDYSLIEEREINALQFYFSVLEIQLDLAEDRTVDVRENFQLPRFGSDLLMALSKGVDQLTTVIKGLIESKKFDTVEDIEPLILTHVRLSRFGLIVSKLLP